MLEVAFLRIRPERVALLERWMAELAQRRDESLETFRREGTRHEVVHLLEVDAPVLVYAMDLEDPDRARRVYARSELPIDAEHRRVMDEVSAGAAPARKLFDLRQPGI